MSVQSTITLSRGELSLSYQPNPPYRLDDLLGFAERINPKRAFLFVSKVLGRHIPVAPTLMRQAFTDLSNLLPDHLLEPIIVIGMAETAVGLSAGVHQVLQQRYPNALLLNSTRHTLPEHNLLTIFDEQHSHASTHLIYQSANAEQQQQVLNARTLIMVDDEASTGQTCQNVVNALRNAGLTNLEQVHLATLVDWSMQQVKAQPFKDLAFFRHHLLAGHWQWTDRPHTAPVTMPRVDTIEAGSQPILPTGNWGRTPTLDSTAGLAGLQDAFVQSLELTRLIGKKVLVLGSNEFVWLPFLLAEWLEQQGVIVKFGALTRSPIAINPESAVKAVLSFADNYGLGMTNFVYNVVPAEWDIILLCIETPIESVDPVWQQLDNVMVISPK